MRFIVIVVFYYLNTIFSRKEKEISCSQNPKFHWTTKVYLQNRGLMAHVYKTRKKKALQQRISHLLKKCTMYSPKEEGSIPCTDVSASKHSSSLDTSSSYCCKTTTHSLNWSTFYASQQWSLTLRILPISRSIHSTWTPHPLRLPQPLPLWGLSFEEFQRQSASRRLKLRTRVPLVWFSSYSTRT